MSSTLLNVQLQIWRRSSTSADHYALNTTLECDMKSLFLMEGRKCQSETWRRWNLLLPNGCKQMKSLLAEFPNWAPLHLAHTPTFCRWERECPLYFSPGAWEGKKKVARGAISSRAQAGLARTHWHFQLITGYSHNPFSVFSVQGY